MWLSLSSKEGEATATARVERWEVASVFLQRSGREARLHTVPSRTSFHFSPAPPSRIPNPGPDRRPYKITPSLTRTRTRNAIFLNHHFRVKSVLPECQLPPPTSPVRPFAGGCQTTVAQAHQRPRRARRALSALCTRLPSPALPRRAPPALAQVYARDVIEA